MTSPTNAASVRPAKSWYGVVALATLISLYGLMVLVVRVYPEPLEDSFRARPWGIYSHVFFAVFALAVGPWQFRGPSMRRRNRRHKHLGRIYVAGALGASLSGLYMAVFAHGGLSTKVGFGMLAIALFAATALGLQKILQGDVASHRAWMLRSYALIFAGVTLRLWLPPFIAIYDGDFDRAYPWVAWFSWVPNMLWAEWFLRRPAKSTGLLVAS